MEAGGPGDGEHVRPAVLRVITRLNVGGPARQALLLTRELAADFPTTLAAGKPSLVEGEMSDPAVPVRRLPLVRQPRPGADVQAVAAVRRLLAETGARILHTHMAKAGTVGRLAALTSPAAAAANRPRTVHTFHGHVLDGYFRPSVARVFVETERRLARRTDVLIAVSAEIRDELLALGVGRADQYQVIPLGLDLSSYLKVDGPSGALRSRLGVPGDCALIGAVGRLVPVKDLETLLEAVARLPEVHLALIGDGESRPALEALATVLGLGRRVHFTGWVSDVAAAVSDLDVVVLTSRTEGTPASLIEAGACGRPVVATRVGGVPLVVQDGVTGLLAAPGRPDEVAARVQRLLADPALGRSMGAAARAHVRTRFGQERLVDDVRQLYTDLLGRPPARRLDRRPAG